MSAAPGPSPSQAHPQPGRRRWASHAARGAGFLLCIGLFGWAVRGALAPENRAALTRLGDATPIEVVSLFALSFASLVLNGAMFKALLSPVQRIPMGSTQAINAVAALLGYAMKLGAVARVLLHARCDRVPLLVVGGWFGAVLVCIAASVLPATAAALLSPRAGAWWWLVAVALLIGAFGAVVLAARPFRGERGLDRLHRLLDPLAVGPLRRVLRSARFAELHTGVTMLADARAMSVVLVLRTLDVAAQAARFALAGEIVGHPATAPEAVAVSSGAFVIQIASPFGVLGAREAGTIGLAEALRDAPAPEIAVVALVVTGSEALVLIPCAGLAAVWLLRRAARPTPPASAG